jgi:putative OPT family oligopeptide transporter
MACPAASSQGQGTELSLWALSIGVLLAIVLAAGNTYMALEAGLTVSGMFPAAVLAVTAARLRRKRFGETLGEQNVARATGSVGEALAAGAAFTIPAFLLGGTWDKLDWGAAGVLTLGGALLGLLLTSLLRKRLVNDASREFPEAEAGYQLVRAGQGQGSRAGLVLGYLGVAAVIEFLRNVHGVPLLGQSVHRVFSLRNYHSAYQLPGLAPGIFGVGVLIGPRTAATLFAGSLLGWFVLLPVSLQAHLPEDQKIDLATAAGEYKSRVMPLAVGVIIVGAVFTLCAKSRKAFYEAIKGIWDRLRGVLSHIDGGGIEHDLQRSWVLLGAIGSFVALCVFLGWHNGDYILGLLLAVFLIPLCLVFAAASAYIVGEIGSSANPISGLALCALLLTAGLLFLVSVSRGGDTVAILMTTCHSGQWSG